MKTGDLEKYLDLHLVDVSVAARVIDPASVVTAPWVAFKCLYGCKNQTWMCPPYSPDCRKTREVLDSYDRAILFNFQIRPEMASIDLSKSNKEAMVKMEGDLFKDGFYKAYVFLNGPCMICKECGRKSGASKECISRDKARPSMEACGIDVYRTARNNGFSIETLRTRQELRNSFCLMMVD